MQNNSVIILAAGDGKRMKTEIPKPMHLICGKPILEYLLDVSEVISKRQKTVVVGFKHKQVMSFFADRKINWSYQSKRLGTAHAVKSALKSIKVLKGNVMVLVGDCPLIRKQTLKAFYNFHNKQKADCTVLTFKPENPASYGRIVRDKKNILKKIIEFKDATPSEKKIREVNSGVFLFKASVIKQFLNKIKLNKKKNEYYLTDIIEILLNANKKVRAFCAPDHREFIGINTRADLALATRYMQQLTTERLMSNGVSITRPDLVSIEADVKIGKDTTIFPFTAIGRGCVIGKNCKIGPFTQIRGKSVIRDNVEIGNFTEVKNSEIKHGAKAKHLSYLGDCSIGSKVNIGAGTITANYDGKYKHPTIVEQGAFIGSGTILIAPVKIGKGAITGAGAVITRGKNVKDKSVVIGVPAKPVNNELNDLTGG